jgi:hypothetical protein
MRRIFVVMLLASCGKPPATPPPVKTQEPVVEAPKVAPPPPPCPSLAELEPNEAAAIPTPNRPLTTGERALLRPLYGNAIDYDKVRVIDNSFVMQPEGVYVTPRGHIYAPGALFRDDFSTGSPGDRAVFVHEIGHVWQFANGMNLLGQGLVEFVSRRGKYQEAYPYTLDASRDLSDYGMEQQASILEDYYITTVLRGEPHSLQNRGLTLEQRAALYTAVLKKFLADSCYLRAKLPNK